MVRGTLWVVVVGVRGRGRTEVVVSVLVVGEPGGASRAG